MYCKNCGKQIDDDAKFCPYCGVMTDDGGFNNYNTNAYAPYSQPTNQPYSQPAKEYNIMAILGVIFAIIGFGSIVMGISGLVCSIIGFNHAAKTGKNKGAAVAGIVLSIIAIVVQVIVIIAEIIEGSTIDGAVYY